MAKTYGQIKAQARTYLDEATEADWDDEEVNREVNNSYQEIVTAVMEVYEDFYLTSDLISLVENQQEYGSADGFPTNIFKLRRVEVNYDTSKTNSIFYPAIGVTMDDIRSRLNDATSGVYSSTSPVFYTYGFDSNFKLGLLPVPAVDSANGLKLWHIPYIADLVDDDDTFNIPYADRYAQIAGKMAAGILLRKGQQEEPASAQYMGEAMSDLERMKQQLENHVAGDGKRVTITDPMNTDFGLNNTHI